MASQLPQTAHPLRTARFHPRGLHENRLLHHMLATPAKVILLTPLSGFKARFGPAEMIPRRAFSWGDGNRRTSSRSLIRSRHEQQARCTFRSVRVDGCRAGWFVVKQCGCTGAITTKVIGRFEDLLDWTRANAIVAVDMPIGLSSNGLRTCDTLARKKLGRPRGSSVFFSTDTRGTICIELRRSVRGQSRGCRKANLHSGFSYSQQDRGSR